MLPIISSRHTLISRFNWRLILVPFLLIATVRPPVADVRPPSLSRLIGISDLVIHGNVAGFSENTLDVESTEVLAGVAPSRQIEVVIPKRWPDEPRWVPYEVGQTFILFLGRRVADQDSRWRISGAFGRGEFPTSGGFVYLLEYFEGLGAQHYYQIFGTKALSQRVDMQLFFSAVGEYSQCFVWKAHDKPSIRRPSRICSDAMAIEYASRSPFHRFLAKETQRIVLRYSADSQ